MPRKKIHLQLDENLIAYVRELAYKEERTISGMFAWLVRRGLERQGFPPAGPLHGNDSAAVISLEAAERALEQTDPSVEGPDPHDWWKSQ